MTREIPVGREARAYIQELWLRIDRLEREVAFLKSSLAHQAELHRERAALLEEQLQSFRESLRAHTEEARLSGLVHAADIADLKAERQSR